MARKMHWPADAVHSGNNLVFSTPMFANEASLHVQAIKILNMIKVYGKPIRVNKASQDKKQMDVGANLFIGNLDPDVDEKVWAAILPWRRM